jgi:hypothetical protein
MRVKREDSVTFKSNRTELGFELDKSYKYRICDHCATGSQTHVSFSMYDLFVSVSLARPFLLTKRPNAKNGEMKACQLSTYN